MTAIKFQLIKSVGVIDMDFITAIPLIVLYLFFGMITAFTETDGETALFVLFLWPIALLIYIFRGFLKFVGLNE